MGLYTVYDDQRIDDAVAEHLDRVVENLTAVLPVSSVILGGGFGRGEGGVLVTAQQIQPVNDYDFFLVLPDDFAGDLKGLERDLARQVNIRHVDLIPLHRSALAGLPANQLHYDLKYGGRTLWGEDALAMMPAFPAGVVEAHSANTSLLSRLICAIEAFSQDFETRPLSGPEGFFLVNQTGKFVSACIEALLIGRGRYHHSYLERQRIFAREFPEKTALGMLGERATAFKTRPALDFGFDPVSYWKDAVRAYLEVLAPFLTSSRACSKWGLWRALKSGAAGACLTNNPVERIELMLLLSREAPFFSKGAILSRARKELGRLAGTPPRAGSWEDARGATASLWHELYH